MAKALAIAEERLLQALGRPRVPPRSRGKAPGVVGQARSGLPYACLEALASRFSIARDELVGVLALAPRTLARRKRERRFRADESDRLLRVGRIAVLAETVLGDRVKAGRWLRARNRALGDEPPLALLDTDFGAHQVEAVLLRAAHGVHS